MSNSALNWAWEQEVGSGVAKSVLIYLANCASRERGDCYPSLPNIVARVEHGERAVRKAIATLLARGLIEREQRTLPNGRCTSPRYRLPVVVLDEIPLENTPKRPQTRHPRESAPRPYPCEKAGVPTAPRFNLFPEPAPSDPCQMAGVADAPCDAPDPCEMAGVAIPPYPGEMAGVEAPQYPCDSAGVAPPYPGDLAGVESPDSGETAGVANPLYPCHLTGGTPAKSQGNTVLYTGSLVQADESTKISRTLHQPPHHARARVREAAVAPAEQQRVIVEAWNEMAERVGLRRVRIIGEHRRRHLKARLHEHGLDGMLEAIAAVEASDFCCGGSESGWTADFDFVLQAGGCTKLREGKYAERRIKLSKHERIRRAIDPSIPSFLARFPQHEEEGVAS